VANACPRTTTVPDTWADAGPGFPKIRATVAPAPYAATRYRRH